MPIACELLIECTTTVTMQGIIVHWPSQNNTASPLRCYQLVRLHSSVSESSLSASSLSSCMPADEQEFRQKTA